jgi:hypothetical protein
MQNGDFSDDDLLENTEQEEQYSSEDQEYDAGSDFSDPEIVDEQILQKSRPIPILTEQAPKVATRSRSNKSLDRVVPTQSRSKGRSSIKNVKNGKASKKNIPRDLYYSDEEESDPENTSESASGSDTRSASDSESGSDTEEVPIKNKKQFKSLSQMSAGELQKMKNPLSRKKYDAQYSNSKPKIGRPEQTGFKKEKPDPNERIDCEVCGKNIKRSHRSVHRRTKYHQMFEQVNARMRELIWAPAKALGKKK